MTDWLPQVPMKAYTTLWTGGPAEWLTCVRSSDHLGEVALESQQRARTITYLGMGSNVLPSDAGVPGYVVINEARRISVDASGDVIAECGCSFQELFLKTAQRGLGGLEFAVGIPGTLGGALVSNAGAYRSNVSEFLVEIEVVEGGVRRWEDPTWMEFSYRDSILRRPTPPDCALIQVRMKLPKRRMNEVYSEARDYQRQRISKQPPPASAGSFFKNVESHELAAKLPSLPARLKEAGVVPAGYLIEQAGLMGHRIGGAMFASRHANFIVNVGGATATDIRRLATLGKAKVLLEFGVELEEEVLYLGDWSDFIP